MIDAINSVIVRAYVSLKREEGQTFVEYSLIGVLVAVALVTVARPPSRATSSDRSDEHRRRALSSNSIGGGR